MSRTITNQSFFRDGSLRPGVLLFATLLALCSSADVFAWGATGHSAVGILAIEQVDDTARAALTELLGEPDHARLRERCNWPDAWRETDEGAPSSPRHYVNIPRAASAYDRQRDCREGLCVGESIKKFAQELGDLRLDKQRRSQAFAWLCHLAGDLHQPLHCGFPDDRGGNTVDVEFAGKAMDLHDFWDDALIAHYAGSLEELMSLARADMTLATAGAWNPGWVDVWLMESHQLAEHRAYPPDSSITIEFADASWQLVRQRIALAAGRLALMLNALLGEGRVEIAETPENGPLSD